MLQNLKSDRGAFPRRHFKEGPSIYRSSLFIRRKRLMTRWRVLWSLVAAMAVLSFVATSVSKSRHSLNRRNPFQIPHRRLLIEDTTTSNTNTAIRYLSFGGPSTWGVGLENPEPIVTIEGGVTVISTHQAAYPYRLSPNVHNAAQRVGGPTLAALCAQSIVHRQEQDSNSIYDVITMEFSTSAQQEADLVALDLLAYRLRTRYPNAVLVIVQLWSPSHYYFENDEGNKGTIDFATWRYQQQQQHDEKKKRDWNWNSMDWQEMLHDKEWKYSEEASMATTRLSEIASKVQGRVVKFAPSSDPIHDLETANKWYTEVREDYTGNMENVQDTSSDQEVTYQYTLSSKGHLVVASHIRSIVDQANILKRPLEERNLVADWKSGDQCQLWYDYDPDGERSSTIIPKHSSSITLQAFAKDKYALEVPAWGGSIIVQSSFNEERMLYLTYMTTSASSSRKIYPQVQVQIVQQGQTSMKKGVVIDPYHDDDTDPRHVTRTTAVGTVPALASVEIRIQPLQEALAPFRLVGASFLAKEKVQWQIAAELALEPERVHARRRLYQSLRVFR